MNRIHRFITILVVTAIAPLVSVRADEHPEHPKKTGDAAKSEHPSKDGKEASLADISTGIKKHIDAESKKSADGKMHVKYEGKDLALDLVKVHEDRLSSLGSGKYFACVDLKATDGVTYDVDFFLSGKPGDMNVTETSIHKVNGKALYNWQEQKDGTWKKVDAKA